MEKKFKRTTVTSALPYANGPVHIGHLAGVYVPADIYVRYLRLKKEDVLFIGGSDEHGVPITIRAKKEGCTPQDIVDRYHTLIRDSFKEFGISFDVYGRTSSEVITKRLLTSSAPFTIKASSSKRLRCNITMKKRRLSLPTVTLRANARIAMPKEHTATNARSAAPLFRLRNLSIRRVLSAEANP